MVELMGTKPEQLDCVVIGAGVVGLAVARELALVDREVFVIEHETTIGVGNSSRNSEVIHARIYYAPSSLKARLCVEGRDLLYRYCKEQVISHRRCGKLIVATSKQQLLQLEDLEKQANLNGVGDLQRLTPEEVSRMEPGIVCVGALYSPSTGIIDSHGLMLSLQKDVEENGAMMVFRHRVKAGRPVSGRVELSIEDLSAGSTMKIAARTVVNAAGLGAIPMAEGIHSLDSSFIPQQRMAKGNYFRLIGASPVSRLVYPLPVPGGLGVHITIDLAGRVRFGPDVEWINEVEHQVDERRSVDFYESIRSYYPGLADHSLIPDYAGIRPKIVINGETSNDFLISGPHQHRISGLINLFGIESPGLTASLSIAKLVCRITNSD